MNLEDEKFLIGKPQGSSVDLVIENIKGLLISKRLVRGDKIPNEEKLAEAMSVSRGTIREAMKILAAFKIVEIRRGDGTYINTSIDNTIFDPLLFNLIISDYEINQLVELRELFELGLAKLVIDNADEDDFENMSKACAEMEECAKSKEKDPEILLKCDLDFHSALGRATKNILVSKIYDFMMEFLKTRVHKALQSKEAPERALKIHTDIYEDLRKRDLKKAEEAIMFSIEEWKKEFSR